MANETLGASFSIDVTNLKAGLSQANRMIRESESEFKAAAAGMDDWRDSEEGLSAKIKSLNNITGLQREKVRALQEQYDTLIDKGLDPTSKEAVELRTKINSETAAMKKNEKQIQDLIEEMRLLKKETGETSEKTEEAAEETDKFASAGEVAKSALAALAAACAAAVTAFFGLAESTRETRKLMGQLETAFESAGHKAETAEATFKELYGIMGDEGAATEAAQQLAKFANDEESLAASTRILTGVMAEYGNSIPTEGLAEGMAATAAMGEVQGVLADALEWQGVNLDKYNAQLAKLKTEEERAAYIQQTLTDLYGESADAYRENNSAIIEANHAQADLNDVLADFGAIAEPIMTTLKTMVTGLLQSIEPFVQLMGEGLAGALDGSSDAADKLAEGLSGIISTLLEKIVSALPFVIETIVAVIPKLITALLEQLPTILEALLSMVVQVIGALGEMLPDVLQTIMRIVPMLITSLLKAIPQLLQAAVQLLLAIVKAIPLMVTELAAALPTIIETISTVLLDSIDILIEAAVQLLMAIVDAIPLILDPLIGALPQIIETLLVHLVKFIPALIQGAIKLFLGIVQAIPKMIPSLLKAIPDIIMAIVQGLTDGISSVQEVGKDIIEGLWNGISDMASWIGKKIKGFGEDVLGGIKDFFGIHSPSKVMADEVGKNLALGIGEGFENNIAGVNKQITDAMNFDGTGNVNVVGNIGRRAANGVVVNQTNYYSQAHSRIELYKTKQATAAAVRLAMTGA